MTKSSLTLISSIPLIILLSTPAASKEDSVIEQLLNCARTEDRAVRAECYEVLGKQVLEAESGKPSMAPVKEAVAPAASLENTPDNASSDALPESAGGGKFSNEEKVDRESWTAVLKTCKRTAAKKWAVMFENGQVWKQVDSRRIRRLTCSGSVTIEKDGFGYKMMLKDGKGGMRIKRQR